MEDHEKKAFDFALKQTETLIALSTGIITLLIAFKKEFIMTGDSSFLSSIKTSLICFLISIVFGIFTFGNLTKSLNDQKFNIYKSPTMFWSILQHLLFFIALLSAINFTLNFVESKKQVDNFDYSTKIVKYSIYFPSGSLMISDDLNEKTIIEITNFINLILPKSKVCKIVLKGYSDKHKIIHINDKVSNNFELSYGRIVNVQSTISNLIFNSKSRKFPPIEYNISNFSNEASSEMNIIDRRVDVYFYY